MKDEIKIKKKKFLLCNCPYPNKKIFKLITKNIPNSIFTILDFSFFKEMVNKKIIDLYIIKKNKKISSIITVTSFKNYQKLKRNIINYLFYLKVQLQVLYNYANQLMYLLNFQYQ